MQVDLARLFTSNRRSRRTTGHNVGPCLIEHLENRSLLSTVQILTPIVGSAKVTATDKKIDQHLDPRDPPETLTATWDKTGKISSSKPWVDNTVMASSGGLSGAKVGVSKGTGKNPSLIVGTTIVMNGFEWSATAESGSGVRGGDPIDLRILPEEDESLGTRVLVTLTVTGYRGPNAFNHAFHTEYHFENETHTIASGTLLPTTLTKTVTFEAEIGEVFDIAFSLEGSTTANSCNAYLWMTVKAEPVKVDLVPKSLAWDPTKGGLSFKYAINEGSLPSTKPPKVELFWAVGTKTIGNAIALSGFKPATKQGEYSFNVPGKQLRNVPKGATHLVLVLDRLNAITETNEENNKKSVADVAIRLGPDVEGVVKVPTVAILKRLQRDAGQAMITITSMERTPLRQAQIMFDNCLKQGASSQLKIYGAAGDAVIQVYVAQTKGLSAEQIRTKRNTIVNLMLKKIQSFKPMSQVSHHIVDGNDLQVVDIAPSSFASTATLNRFITSSLEAKSAGLISHIIRPGVGEKALHLEIPL